MFLFGKWYIVYMGFGILFSRLTGTYEEAALPNYVCGDDASVELVFHTDISFQDTGFLVEFSRFDSNA